MSSKQFKYKSKITANWERIPKVEGRVFDRGVLSVEGKERPYLMVETETDQVQVFQSTGLDDLFKVVERGDRVSIEFLALVTTSKNRTMRQFRSSCWTEEADAPLPKLAAVAPSGGRRASAKS